MFCFALVVLHFSHLNSFSLRCLRKEDLLAEEIQFTSLKSAPESKNAFHFFVLL